MTSNITPIEYKWIQCDEQLPEEYSWVKINICYHREDYDVNYSKIAHFRKGVFEFQDGDNVIVKPNEYFYLYGQKESREVTHWMVDYPPQALAPQECDVEQCDFWQQGETNEGLFDFCTGYCDNCNKHPNCNFRQLHPQQKTFTLEGIKEKIKYFENTHNSEVVNFMFKRLLAEFEKEAK